MWFPPRESRAKEGRGDGKSRSGGEGKKKAATWRLPPVPRLEKVRSLIVQQYYTGISLLENTFVNWVLNVTLM